MRGGACRTKSGGLGHDLDRRPEERGRFGGPKALGTLLRSAREVGAAATQKHTSRPAAWVTSRTPRSAPLTASVRGCAATPIPASMTGMTCGGCSSSSRHGRSVTSSAASWREAWWRQGQTAGRLTAVPRCRRKWRARRGSRAARAFGLTRAWPRRARDPSGGVPAAARRTG